MPGAWTNNWEGIKRAWATNCATAGTIINTGGGAVTSLYNENGYYANLLSPLTTVISGTGSGQYTCGRIQVKVGGQEQSPIPSATDYNIFGPITSNMTYVNVVPGSAGYNAKTGVAMAYGAVTIQNSDPAARTIREWGLFTWIRDASGTSHNILLYRATLDEPIVLQQYETITIKFTRRMQLDVPNSGT